EIQKLLLADLEYEIIQPLAVGAGAAPRAATAGRWPGNGVAGDEFTVAGQHMGHLAAPAVAERGLVGVPAGDAHFLAAVGVGDAAVAQAVLHRLANLFAVALDKALAVDGAFILAVESAIDEIGHGWVPDSSNFSRFASHISPWVPGETRWGMGDSL